MKITKPASRKDYSKIHIMYGHCGNCLCDIECFDHETEQYDPESPSIRFVYCPECGSDIPVYKYKD